MATLSALALATLGARQLWNGVQVESHAHVSGRGGPQDLKGSWSEPLNTDTNVLCTLNHEDERLRCPSRCARSHAPAGGPRRVRRAIHKMSDAEWQKVVDAMWVMRTTDSEAGRKRYGDGYRDMDYHVVRHVLGTLPGLDNVSRGEIDHPPMDVTGGAAHTYTWHALFTMELETSMLAVDPTIEGLPYFDWGAMVDADVAAIYRRRLGVGTAAPADASDFGEMGSLDVLMAWEAYKRTHGGLTPCLPSATRACEPRLLLDGSFARWPVPAFDWRTWYGQQSERVQRLLHYVARFPDQIISPLVHRGQLRCNASGTSVHAYPADGHSDDATPAATAARAADPAVAKLAAEHPPVEFVVRGKGTFEHIFVNRSGEWRDAVHTCLYGMDGGLYQDMSECVEGRMKANRFGIHFEAHFLGGDMGWAVIPHDPIFFFHHNGLDRLRRQWQARHAHLKPMAYGYPIASPGYEATYKTPVGLRDCLGCTAYQAGFTKELLLGTSDAEVDALPISDGWLTSEDLLCVIDDLYTFDAILEQDEKAAVAAKGRGEGQEQQQQEEEEEEGDDEARAQSKGKKKPSKRAVVPSGVMVEHQPPASTAATTTGGWYWVGLVVVLAFELLFAVVLQRKSREHEMRQRGTRAMKLTSDDGEDGSSVDGLVSDGVCDGDTVLIGGVARARAHAAIAAGGVVALLLLLAVMLGGGGGGGSGGGGGGSCGAPRTPQAVQHTVLFKLRPMPADVEAQLQGVVASFNTLPGIRASFRAAGLPRADGVSTLSKEETSAVLEWPDKTDGFTHALFAVAEDAAALKAYLKSELHTHDWVELVHPYAQGAPIVFDSPLAIAL